jgi:hypothetical protein
MALHPDHVAALIDVRVAELRLLAAQTAVRLRARGASTGVREMAEQAE